MSGFRAFVREELKRRQPAGGVEWDRVFRDGAVDAAFARVKRIGGDPDFCFYLVTECRWRLLRPFPDLQEREEIFRAVTTLEKASGGIWAESLQHASRGLEWGKVQEFFVNAREEFGSVSTLDEGVFSISATEQSERGWTSERQSICLSLLDRHIKHGSGRKRSERRILADLMRVFGLVSERLKDPERWVEKRLERLSSNTRRALGFHYMIYCALHEGPKAPHTRACELFGLGLKPGRYGAEEEERLFLGGPVSFALVPFEGAPTQVVDSRGTL